MTEPLKVGCSLKAELQEIFNAVWERAKDKRKSLAVKPQIPGTANWECRYRGSNGLKCFAGVLIPDESYVDTMEHLQAHHLAFFRNRYSDEARIFIRRLQKIHDNDRPEDWESWLRDEARERGLEVPQ